MRNLILPILASGLAACGGGSSGGSPADPVDRPDGALKGMVTDAVVTNATVDFYRYTKEGKKEFLAESVTTDSKGKFTQTINDKDGFVLVRAKGGSYVEEESGKVITLGPQHELHALTYYTSGTAVETIPNPWSTIAFGYTECMLAAGESVGKGYSEGVDMISGIIGMPILTTYPTNPTYQTNAYVDNVSDGIRFGALAAGISKWTFDEGVKQGFEGHTPGLTSVDLALTMYKDVQADCKLDGYGIRPDGVKRQLAFGKRQLDANVYRTEIARKMLEFMASDKNLTRVSSADLVLYANQQASSTAVIFGETPTKPLDEDGPFILHSVTDDQYVYGQVKFQVDASDISGVGSVKVTIGGQVEEVVSGSNSEISFNSTNFADGPIEVRFEAIDGLKNVTQKVITLNVQNQKPIMRLKSPDLVNTSNYAFEMDVDNLPQGLKAAFVNNQPMTVEGLFVWGEVSLRQNENHITVSIVDKMGVTHEHKQSIFLDLNKPVLNSKVPSLDINEQFKIRYLPKDSKEPVYRNFKPKSEEAIYVPRDRQRCGDTYLNEENLRKLAWPYVAIDPKDVGDSVDREPTSDGLTVLYSYEIEGEVRKKDAVAVVSDEGRYFVPFCVEYLGDSWWEANDRPGTGTLSFKVIDKAGNIGSGDFQFTFAESPTTLEPELGETVFFSGTSNVISYDYTGLEGVDSVELYIDGSYHTSIVDYESGKAHINAEKLKDGLHEAHFIIKDNGYVVLETEPMKFRIDNTKPSIKLVSKPVTGQKRTVVEFLVDDGVGSGFDSKSISISNRALDGKEFNAIKLTENGTYTVAVDMIPGKNPLVFEVRDHAGNEENTTFDNVGYDATAPALSWVYPDLSIKVFGYNKNDPINPIVLQSFLPNGASYPLYLNTDMIGFEPTGQESFQNFRLLGEGDALIGWRPLIATSVYDVDDESEWGSVGSDHIKQRYEVFVEGKKEAVFQRDINGSRFGFSSLLAINKEDLGDDFFRVNETTGVTVRFHLEDEVGHKSSYDLTFKVYFDPGKPLVRSTHHNDAVKLSSTTNIADAQRLTSSLKSHSLKISNPFSYPIWVSLEDHQNDSVKLTREKGRLVNMYREVYSYERRLVRGFKIEKGNGADPNYYMIKKQFPESTWSTEQVLSGSTEDVYLVPENQNRIEMPYLKQYRSVPAPSMSAPAFLPIHASGVLEFDEYVYSPSSNTDCNYEPDQCWWKVSEPKVFTVKGSFRGIFLDDNSLQYRKHTSYEVMSGYPQPELQMETEALLQEASTLAVNGSSESKDMGGARWYLIEPKSSVDVTRSISFKGDLKTGECNWSYDRDKTCLNSVFGSLGDEIIVRTRVQTLDGKLGPVVKSSKHLLESVRFKVSR